MKKIALYCRVSTAEQTTENQKLRLVQYVGEKKLKYDVYEETESTRKTRPVKAGLMQKLRQGEYSAVLVFKLDRWARSSSRRWPTSTASRAISNRPSCSVRSI